jgi:pimeloyl-ACP methyl ester carboxylesterase
LSLGTVVFVHGTGIRLPSYTSSFEAARKRAAENGIEANFAECAWGDPFGIQFEGYSLPGPPPEEKLREEAEDFARWAWLFDDPLFELDKLTIRDAAGAALMMGPPGSKPKWLLLWEEISAYEPSLATIQILKRGELQEFWEPAWALVVGSDVTCLAFERSAHELPQASGALARAVVASLHVHATAAGRPGPNRHLRNSLVQHLLHDWDQIVLAPSDFLARLFRRAATSTLRRHRDNFSAVALLPIGDILLYQSRGADVRNFIRETIEAAEPPVTVVAHSLGGIACFDLLALPNPPKVARLVTVGSQPPLLYEIGALASINMPTPLPLGFPTWLNIFDRNDFLSYLAAGLLNPARDLKVKDLEVKSGQPFPDAHSAYFTNDVVWEAIRDLMKS